ncbi:MAG: MBL fold metallo-hydrolase [Gemmatimonadetes bacterium]|nr:MBL fold metallo-hydrolase [Gemmatimonadota bacterium]
MTVQVTFWGVRGSIAAPGKKTARYGGDTPCVVLTNGSDGVLVLDAGTGIRLFGEWLTAQQPATRRIDVLLSHVHWDHIQGLPFFKPLYQEGYRIGIRGPAPEGRSLEEVLRQQMDPVVFPVPLARAGAEVTVDELEPGRVTVSSWIVDTIRLQHPGVTFGYRVQAGSDGPSIGYLTDNELGGGDRHGLAAGWYHDLARKMAGVDVLIHDAMYTDAMQRDRNGWGHSTPREAVDLALACGAKHLVLFHHDPAHDDTALDRIVDQARRLAAKQGSLSVDGAREGQTISL